MNKAPTKPAKNSSPARPQKASEPGGLPAAAPGESDDEAARLLAAANSFLRLGLVDKAIDHLAAALKRDPSLRSLREPLMKLYVSKRQYQKAVGELWALLSPCEDPWEEIRLLRYILRLDENDPVAARRLKAVLSRHQAETAKSGDAGPESKATVSGVVEELRAYLDSHRPLSDFARTANLHEAETQHPFGDGQSPAVTRPSSAAVEELAEELALSSGSLKEQLRELDECLRQKLYSEAQRRLWALRERYPHSRQVRARIKQLEQAKGEATVELAPVAVAPPEAGFHSAPTLPPAAQPLAVRGPGPRQDLPGQNTLEVALEDIREEQDLPASAPPAYPPPPPLPRGNRRPRREQSLSDAESALRSGAMLWNSGRRMQAIAMFEKAQEDATCGTIAALMAGLCYRELDRPEDAIASFMRAIKRPELNDKDLSWLFYELGTTHEQLKNTGEALLFYQMSLGPTGSFRDAKERIAGLQAALLPT